MSISCPADGKDRSTVRILTTQCPSQVIAQDPFSVAFNVEVDVANRAIGRTWILSESAIGP
jgi:hypothetical protein